MRSTITRSITPTMRVFTPTMPLTLVLVWVLVVALAGCAPATAPRQLTGHVVAKPTVEPTPEPVPETAPPAPPPMPQGEPIRLDLQRIDVTSGSNAPLFGTAPPPADPATAEGAVNQAADLLVRFLNAQLVDRRTYWSDAGLAVLMDPTTVDDPTRGALGVLEGVDVRGTVTGPAAATAEVLLDGAVLQAVTLTYSATVDLVVGEDTGPVTHSGVITFTPLQGRLTLAGVQPTTTFGGTLTAVLS